VASASPKANSASPRISIHTTALAARLQQLDPANAAQYAQRQASFTQRWQQAMARWTRQAAPLKGANVASQHKGFPYLYDWLGLKEIAVLEPKPGIEPTPSHLQEVLATIKAQPVRMVMYAAYQDPRPCEWLSKNAGIPAVKLPFTVGGDDAAKDLFGLFDDTVARLTAAAASK
jgi:zinc/manganese transport system substrate-binding protein